MSCFVLFPDSSQLLAKQNYMEAKVSRKNGFMEAQKSHAFRMQEMHERNTLISCTADMKQWLMSLLLLPVMSDVFINSVPSSASIC